LQTGSEHVRIRLDFTELASTSVRTGRLSVRFLRFKFVSVLIKSPLITREHDVGKNVYLHESISFDVVKRK